MLSQSIPSDEGTIVLSVYFSGTGFFLNREGLFSTKHATVSDTLRQWNEDRQGEGVQPAQMAYGFEGCGTENVRGLAGAIYGAGVHDQVREVVELVNRVSSKNHKIVLNMYGHSRGGVTALLVAKALQDFDKNELEINMALMDPVPGNFGLTVALDPASCTLADQAMDLSQCRHLKKVLRLYPYEDATVLPLIAHTPLVSKLPPDCEVEDDVMMGAHAYAELLVLTERKGENPRVYRKPALAMLDRVKCFMEECGTRYNPRPAEMESLADAGLNNESLYEYYQDVRNKIKPSIKPTHSKESAEIVATPGAEWVNKHHRQLWNRCFEKDKNYRYQDRNDQFILALEKGSLLERLKRVTKRRVLMSALKWIGIAAVAVTILYFTGGLAAIPYVAPLVAKVGAWAIAIGTAVMAPAIKLVCKNWQLLLKGAIFAGLVYATGGLAALPVIAPIVAKLGVWTVIALAPIMAPLAKGVIEIYNHTLKNSIEKICSRISRWVMRNKNKKDIISGVDGRAPSSISTHGAASDAEKPLPSTHTVVATVLGYSPVVAPVVDRSAAAEVKIGEVLPVVSNKPLVGPPEAEQGRVFGPHWRPPTQR